MWITWISFTLQYDFYNSQLYLCFVANTKTPNLFCSCLMRCKDSNDNIQHDLFKTSIHGFGVLYTVSRTIFMRNAILMEMHLYIAHFIKPYRDPVHLGTGSR